MKIEGLVKYFQSLPEQEAEITQVTVGGSHFLINCILPVNDERDEFHKRLVCYFVPMEHF